MSDRPKRCYQVEPFRKYWRVACLDYQRNRRFNHPSLWKDRADAEKYAQMMRRWWEEKGGEVVPA